MREDGMYWTSKGNMRNAKGGSLGRNDKLTLVTIYMPEVSRWVYDISYSAFEFFRFCARKKIVSWVVKLKDVERRTSDFASKVL